MGSFGDLEGLWHSVLREKLTMVVWTAFHFSLSDVQHWHDVFKTGCGSIKIVKTLLTDSTWESFGGRELPGPGPDCLSLLLCAPKLRLPFLYSETDVGVVFQTGTCDFLAGVD